jgi:hypothetical protein
MSVLCDCLVEILIKVDGVILVILSINVAGTNIKHGRSQQREFLTKMG